MKRSLGISQRSGFTVVEVVVVIVVLGILTTLAVLGFERFQAQARDSERTSDINVVVEGLEKYYDKNGEYPSCTAMTGSAATVSTTLSVDRETLKNPVATSDNSFSCNDLTSSNTNNTYAYVGDGSNTCRTGSSCLSWTIQYREESTGQLKTISSRRQSALATSGQINLTATVASNSQINLSWNAIPNATSYQLVRATDAGLTTSVSTSTHTGTTASATSLAAGERYYFRITPYIGAQAGAPGTAAATTSISAPSGTLATASTLINGTTARGTATGVSCSGGTLEYQIGSQGRNRNTAVSIGWGTWGTVNVRDEAAAEGHNYTFQSRARCQGSDASSTLVESAQTSVTRGINTPGLPWYTGDTSWSAGYRYNVSWGASCPGGTWLPEDVQWYNTGIYGNARYPGSGANTGTRFDFWYLGWNSGQVDEDVFYYAYFRCTTDFNTSGWSGTREQRVTLTCESNRRSYSANPRCDSHGQDSNSLPWGG